RRIRRRGQRLVWRGRVLAGRVELLSFGRRWGSVLRDRGSGCVRGARQQSDHPLKHDARLHVLAVRQRRLGHVRHPRDRSTGASPLASVRDSLTSGYFAGGWTGAGICSSTAAANTHHETTLGYAEASQLGLSRFGSSTVDSSAIVIRLTYYGDSNLDGAVNT